MAKTTLPTNYVDDMLNSAMDGKRRYREIPNADGTISLEDATTYDQVGSNFGASQLNLMSDNINQSFDANKMLKTMDEVNAVMQEGYGVDALVVKHVNDSLSKLIERLFPYGISLVPTLTSNTGSDGGEAFASSYHSAASIDYKAYKAFDGEESVENNTVKCWHAYWDGSSTFFPQWLGYKFVEPVRATKFTVLPMYASDSGGSRVKTYKYQASNNNIDWVDLTEELIHANDFSKKSDEATKNIGEYLYYRIYIIDNYSTYAVAINELQFYEQL